MRKHPVVNRLHAAISGAFALVAAVTFATPWSTAVAQTTTGSIRGAVRSTDGNPVTDATVIARSISAGTVRNAVTNNDGYYNLAGLRPDRYVVSVRRIGFTARADTVSVLIGQSLTRDYRLSTATATLDAVVVTANTEGAVEMRTSEIATNVTQQQINDLPTADRNFMALAVLAPGTSLQGDRLDGQRKTFSAGAQGPEQVNIFIDGATYKNDILKGGVAGQDASRGNPFPRNAVQEFRILTQNYKAEYQKASSAIITATTKSGGTTWSGDVFFNALTKDWVALDSFQLRDKAANPTGFTKPDYKRYQMGISGGGPLTSRLRVYGAYEGTRQDRSNRVSITPPTGSPALDTINFAARNGAFGSPFRSTLLFGKLTFDQSESSTFDLSINSRHENDIRGFGGNTAFEAATRFKNDVNTGILKHVLTRGSWLNEAIASYQQYHYNPTPESPQFIVNRFYGFGCCAEIGSNISEQDFTQKRTSLRNDLTYSGLQLGGQHIIKGGGNIDFLKYDVIKRNSEIPRFVYEPWYFNFAFPEKVVFQTGDPNFKDSNTQLGAYIQDDWTPVRRLTINLGVRWDYESNMLNRDYVTPRNIVDSLTKYANRLFRPLDPDRYFTDGSKRDRFLGAFQPRIGASYALDERERTTIFGGWGLYYDRTLFDLTTEERFAVQHPQYEIHFSDPNGPAVPGKVRFDPKYLTQGKPALDALIASQQANTAEIKLIPNDLRPPMSQQFTAGIRQLLGNLAVEAAYTGVRSKNTPTFYWANENFVCPQRSFSVPGCFQSNRIPGFGNVLMLEDNGRTWYDALAVKLDRPYRRFEDFGWGAGLAYTFAKRQTEGFNDDFSLFNAVDYPKQARNDERHRVVSNFIVDIPYLYGIQFSGLVTLGSGTRYDLGGRFDQNFVGGGGEAGAYRMVDLRLRKDLRLNNRRVSISADVFNVFNHQNLGCYNNTPNTSDPNFGKAGCVISDPRRLQIGTEASF
ncbi:MAG TPA: TonB-dependent receptor [Gemmatimonadaceae bacterium]|nr:TonB-dependent receptor [Gemmatimonadaceae bacterium]